MKLTAFTDYSLRVLIHVATAPEGRTTIAEVAQAYGISEHHLVKVVHLLGREGFLVNTRGRGGGLRLAAPARSISVGRVVRATEGVDVPVECFDSEHDTCAISGSCRLAGVLDEAMKAFYRVLDAHSLEDLVANRKQLVSILHRFPAVA
ncbi:MAG TPA: Rrf2 family transcriptional regulator [Usitatibacter sp.]|nr:Rrf2 family transcriptional regulator [Usitatibacter sp.]